MHVQNHVAKQLHLELNDALVPPSGHRTAERCTGSANSNGDLHAFQLSQLGHGEFNRALDSATAEVASSGGRMIQAERMAA